MTPSKIKVLLVDDSPIAITLLKKVFAAAPDIEVVGTAQNGKEALSLIPRLDPSVLCTDLHMPVMNGLELTREIMARYPRPVLVISVSVKEGSLNVFKLIEAGALDAVLKPRMVSESEYNTVASELISKIRILSGVRVFRRPKREESKVDSLDIPQPFPKIKLPVRIIVIGASTGGPQAFQTFLPQLPADFSIPIICVQHISEGFLDGLVQWLSGMCAMKVEMAREGGVPMPGIIYFPQEGKHLKFDSGGKFVLSSEPSYHGHRPSITETMRSAAEYYGGAVLSILLSGMGSDGAEGMQAVARAGGITIAQDEKSSIVFGMPKQAIELGAARFVVSLHKIAAILLHLEGKNFCKSGVS
jgi:two-component system chemotaxis response regulator CheB